MSRRFPRSASEAFAWERAIAVEHYRQPLAWLPTALNVLLASAIGVGLALALAAWWGGA